MPIFTTACPRNCYSTCSMRVTVENGRIRRIEPHPLNKATPEGVCLKGLSYVERQVASDRILTPLRKLPKSGKYERISWDAALDSIAERLLKYRKSEGPQSVLYYSASGTKGLLNRVAGDFWRHFGGYTTTYGDLCWPAGLEATRLTLGENKHNVPWDLSNAKLIILWGKNPAETNVHQMPFIEEALKRGAKLVVVDPRRTESSEQADLLIQPKPGTDGALALGVARLLIEQKAVDKDFIDRYVLGYESFGGMVEHYTPDNVAGIAGIAAEQVTKLAEYLGNVKPATICAGFGMQRYTNSGQAMRSIIALLAITGNIGQSGSGWQFANLQSHIFDVVQDPLAFYPPVESDGIARVEISTARLGRDMLATKDPKLRMAWIERGNPVTQNPETHTVLSAIRSLDFRVVLDQFLTDTAREADIVLPAKTMFEQSDVIGAYWHPYIQIREKIIDPPGEVKPETEIYRLLALRLGYSPEILAECFPGTEDFEIEAWLEKKLTSFPELSLESLRKGPILAPGSQEIAFSDFSFPTPSGKIELYSEEAEKRWNLSPLPHYSYPIEFNTAGVKSKYPFHFLTPNTKNRIHSQFNNLKMIREVSTEPLAYLNPKDAEAKGISAGDRIVIFNDRGTLQLPARFDFSLRAGCVVVTNGWWITEGGTVNYLSSGRETDMGHGAAFHDNLVDIRKA